MRRARLFRTVVCLVVVTCALGMTAVAEAEDAAEGAVAKTPPRMSYDNPIWCLRDANDTKVFAQCDEKKKRCLFHRGCVPGSKGPSCKPLERTKGCDSPPSRMRFDKLVKRGFKFEAAIAEAPPGWTRDTRGRVFQTEFDMSRRVWIGGGYAPTIGSAGRRNPGRASVEAGLSVEWLSYRTRKRYRFRVLESSVWMNPLQIDATLLRFDQSTESQDPFLRLTTFWPEPRRHDVHLNMGWWTSVLGVTLRPRTSRDETHMRFVGIGPTMDFWHSSNMASYLRLRAGGALDDLYLNREGGGHQIALTSIAGLEGAFALDQAGMYRLAFSSGYEAPLVFREGSKARPTISHRFMNSVAYEMILLAINDQPITLRISVEGGYRNDLVAEHNGWELRGGAGLRINLWAPAPPASEAKRIRQQRQP